MKEVQWRSKLVSKFRLKRPSDFIWAMDAKFKAGFPDLYVIIRFASSYHYELKMTKKPHYGSMSLRKLFDPIQISVMNSINQSGGNARGLILQEHLLGQFIWMVDFSREKIKRFDPNNFMDFWLDTNHSWGQVPEF